MKSKRLDFVDLMKIARENSTSLKSDHLSNRDSSAESPKSHNAGLESTPNAARPVSAFVRLPSAVPRLSHNPLAKPKDLGTGKLAHGPVLALDLLRLSVPSA